MHPSVLAATSSGTAANGRELLSLAVAGTCLLVALHYLRRMFVPVGELIRAVAAAAMVALSIGCALALLATALIAGR